MKLHDTERPKPVTLELYVTAREMDRLVPADVDRLFAAEGDPGSTRAFLRRVGRLFGAEVAEACEDQMVGFVLVDSSPPRRARYRYLD